MDLTLRFEMQSQYVGIGHGNTWPTYTCWLMVERLCSSRMNCQRRYYTWVFHNHSHTLSATAARSGESWSIEPSVNDELSVIAGSTFAQVWQTSEVSGFILPMNHIQGFIACFKYHSYTVSNRRIVSKIINLGFESIAAGDTIMAASVYSMHWPPKIILLINCRMLLLRQFLLSYIREIAV